MNTPVSVEVFDCLHELLHRFRARMRDSLEAVHPELSFNEMRILMRVGRQPGITQKEIVEHSHADKAQVARTLALLQDKGWLKRRASESDRRVRCLQLSARGQQLFLRLRDLQEQVAAGLLEGCSATVRKQLLGLLQQARDSAAFAPARALSQRPRADT